ncbi:MLO-like protein 1 [Citrus sinensis]|nr:MLO-like protein 1 [Citrus sinensis]
MAEGGTTLEQTPTWVVAILKKKNQKPLFEALQKIKEELMLLGFISLLLTVCQGLISKICMPEHLSRKWLPCDPEKDDKDTKTAAHFQAFFSAFSAHHGTGRRLLADAASEGNCPKGKVPLLSTTALHHLHIFIFVLAVAHVTFCALTILFGGAKIRQWKHWEDSVANEEFDAEEVLKTKFTHVHEHDFIKSRFRGVGKSHRLSGWMNHCRGNPQFNFHRYMMRALEADFKKVVGISWYLWVFVVVFLLLNVHNWHAYFWISFIPFILLLAVGTKLEHIITQLAHEVAEKHVAIEGDLYVKPSDDHFWFRKPRLVLVLIHIILFQNSFEIAVFLWICVQYKFHSCIMGPYGYIIPRLIIGLFVQFFCSYSTLPLYAIVTQMGSSFKKSIFDEHIQEGLVGWAKQAKKNMGLRKAAAKGSNQVVHKDDSSASTQMTNVQSEQNSAIDQDGNNASEIVPDTAHK